MKCKGRFIKLFALLILGFVAINISSEGIKELKGNRSSDLIGVVPEVSPSSGMLTVSSHNQSSEPLDRVYQIIFILFFISPPLIVILLFLIWKELKKRNTMK